jgi:cytochrome c5
MLKDDKAQPVKVVKTPKPVATVAVVAPKPIEAVAEKKEVAVAPVVTSDDNSAKPSDATTAPVDKTAKTGKQIHDTVCFVCHVLTAEAIKAPKTHSNEWDKRMAAGIDAMVASAIKGKGAMPPNAGIPDLSPADLKAAIEFMVSKK